MSYPWETEAVPVAFDASGARCLIVRGPMGALCGYVKLSHDHPLYGVDSAQPVPDALMLASDAAMQGPIGKRGVMDVFILACGGTMKAGMLLDVHGGITFSGCPHCTELPQEGFWYGFDCSHAGDFSPRLDGIGGQWGDDSVYRDLAYVRGEVESLAKQLAQLRALTS